MQGNASNQAFISALQPQRMVNDEYLTSLGVEVAIDPLTGRVTAKATDKATDKTTEKATDKDTEKATAKATDKVTGEVTEKATGTAVEKATMQATERATDSPGNVTGGAIPVRQVNNDTSADTSAYE